MEKILAITSIGIIVLYTFYGMILYKGAPKTLSETYYKTGFLFQICMIFSAVLLMPYLMQQSLWFGYITPFGLISVGVFANFKKNKLFKILHYIGASMSFIGAFYIIGLSEFFKLSISLGGLMIMLLMIGGKNIKESYFFYIELFAFTSLFFYLIISFS